MHLNRFLLIVRKPAIVAGIALFVLMMVSHSAFAQTGGDGALEGTVLDATGAVVPSASVTATNVNTGVVTTRPATGSGFYSITPLIPGMYTVTVTAPGFSTFKQEHVLIDQMHVAGLNIHLKNGAQSETVTVTNAPPALETTNATLGGIIDNDVYTALPIMIAGLQQRDVTQFSNLLPGAQQPPGGRSSIIGGTAQRLGEVYVDGLPMTTASQQGDNRPVFNIVPLEGIDAVQVVTSGFSAEYQGAGLENYSTKSGGNQFHGTVYAIFRNTIFDAWTFSAKPCATVAGCPNTTQKLVNGVPTAVFGPKTPEHQTEWGLAVGGPILKNKLFFFGSFEKFRSYQGANFTATTVPTLLERQGNFTEAGIPIYDPTTQVSCTAHSTNGPCRYQFGFGPAGPNGAGGNPVQVSTPNVIPAGEISPIAQYMQQFLPAPTTNTVISGNYLGGLPQGFHNWLYSGRIDYQVSDKHRISAVLTGGNRHAVPYTSTATSNLPVPYLASTISTVAGHFAELEDSYTFTPHLVNQFKYGFMNFGGPPVQNPTYGIAQYSATAAGITGLPAGQASGNFPIATFGSGTAVPLDWANVSGGSNSTSSTSVSETYELVDNVQWVKGKHALNIGIEYQWLEDNASSADTGSLPVNINYTANSTANLASATAYTPSTGFSYASYMIGATGGSNVDTVTQQPFSVLGGRYHNIAPYFQDDFKVTPKLTLNIGLRWDYMPTFHEVLDRWSFLNPNITNPITGNLGALQFAGNYGGAGVSCGCHTPVNNWWKNFGPRLGFAYSVTDKTVIRGGYAILYTHAGGTGGAGGAATGTGQTGFTSAQSFSDSTAGPAFYLNNNPSFPTGGGANDTGPNANFGGAGFVLPPPSAISTNSQTLDTGNYICAGQPLAPCLGTSGGLATAAGISYADPYLGGRPPEIGFYNLGFQTELAKDLILTVNYVGTQSHFLNVSGGRGLQSNQLNPAIMAQLGPGGYLTKAATTANINGMNTALGTSYAAPYAAYSAAAAISTTPSIGHMLTWMPQFSGVTDTWGNMANANYNALQATLNKRFTNGLTFTINYTYSKNIDDDGTIRSGWAIPASVTRNGKAWAADRIDRSRSVNDLTHILTIFGVYQLPFGKGHLGGNHFATRALASGWQTSWIYQYSSGLVLPIVGSAAGTAQAFGQGTYMPDINPAFSGNPRINGKWGNGITASQLGIKPYIQGYIANTTANSGDATGGDTLTNANNVADTCGAGPGAWCNTAANTIGDSPRTAPFGLRGPAVYRLTMAVSRTFDITSHVKFVFRVDCQNVTNHVTFGNNAQNNQIGVNVNNAAFGTLGFASADPRAFQFGGRINF